MYVPICLLSTAPVLAVVNKDEPETNKSAVPNLFGTKDGFWCSLFLQVLGKGRLFRVSQPPFISVPLYITVPPLNSSTVPRAQNCDGAL